MSDESWRSDLHDELAAQRKTKHKPKPYDTGAWKQRRAQVKDDSVCVLCRRFNVYEVATVADHIMPAANGGFEGALQPLCFECHKIKRRIEAAWRKGALNIRELNLSIGKEAMRLRADAFGVGVDGLPLVEVK